jgi:HK97 gp10 family phage protein
VGFSADYAEHVEFGTSKMAAQPYLRPAIDEHMGEIEGAMMEEVDRQVNP